MRISTQQFYKQNLNSMSAAQQKVLEEQVKIASGKNIQKPSDDPVASARVALLENRLAQSERFSKNAAFADDTLSIQDSNLDIIGNIFLRLKELQVRSGGVIGAEGKEAIALEADQMLLQLESLANTKDSNGKYLYGGAQSTSRPVSKSGDTYVYNGDNNQREVNISSGLKVAVSDSGYDLFMGIDNANGDFTVTNSGASSVENLRVADKDLYLRNIDDYSITFNNAALGYTVTDSAGQTVATATSYTAGELIQFNGIELSISGAIANGDQIDLAAKPNESVFETVQRMVSNLRRVEVTAADSQLIQQENENVLFQIDQLINHFSSHRSEIGSRQQNIARAEETNQEVQFSSKSTISLLEDADIVDAITTLNGFTVALQAAQQSFARVQQLSLFSFL